MDNTKIYELTKGIRKTPLVLQGIVLSILKAWFAVNSEQFKYIPNDELQSKLVIDPSYKWNPENCQNRPGLYVKKQDYIPRGWGKTGMDDLLKVGKNADIQYNVLPVCPIIVFSVGKVPGEVDILAWEAAQVLLSLSPMIKRDFNFNAFDLERIGEIGIVTEHKEFWTVPISITTKFAEAWEVTQVAPILKETLINAYSILEGQLEKGYNTGKYSSEGFGK